jgi:phosphoserine aminotransferase
MGKRIYNFAAGPCTLPLSALEKAQSEFVDFENNGMSLIEMSHRSKGYDAVHQSALSNLRQILAVPETHDIILFQGGATLQFAMIPMNLAMEGKVAAYALTGSWAKKAVGDAEKTVSDVKVIWSGENENFTRVPTADELKVDGNTAYLHITSNETIGGIEYQAYPDTGDVPLVSDMSSHIMSRPVPWDKISLGYGGAQKNLGPAGVTFAIMSKALIEKCNANLPAYLSYKVHSSKGSLYNTPPVFGIYMLKLTTDWVKEVGGLAEMEKRAIKRSSIIYEAIDNSGGWYRCPMDKASRSRMNVCFRLPDEELEKKFIAEALEKGMSGLKGHRSVGGCRASMYNAMPIEGAETLATFMADFKKNNG